MNDVVEIIFWVSSIVGLLSLMALWIMRQNELRQQFAQQDRLREQQIELREQIAELKDLLQARGQASDSR